MAENRGAGARTHALAGRGSSTLSYYPGLVWLVVVLSGVIQYLIHRSGLNLFYPFMALFIPYFVAFRLVHVGRLATNLDFWLWGLSVIIPVLVYLIVDSGPWANYSAKIRIVFFAMLAGSALVLQDPQARKLLRVSSLVVLSFSIPISFVELAIPNLFSTAEGRSAGLYGNPNDASEAILMCLLFAVDLRKITTRSLVLMTLGTAAVFATFSRSGMIFATALWLWYALAPRGRQVRGIGSGQRLILIVGAVVAGGVILAWLAQRGGVTAEATWRLTSLFTGNIADTSSAERIWRAEYSWELIRQHPWGSGMGYVEQAEVRPHNTYLYIGIDYGFPGLLLYFTILLLGLGRALLAGWGRGANAIVLALLMIYSGIFTHYVAGTAFFAVGFAALATGTLIRSVEEDAPVAAGALAGLHPFARRGSAAG